MSVQKRVRGGRTRWIARYRDPAGREHSRTFDTRREALAHLEDQRRDVRYGDWTNPTAGRTTVATLMRRWTEQAERQATASIRQQALRNLGDLADMPIGRVTRDDVEAWIQTLTTGRPWKDGRPLAATTATDYLNALRAALTDAVGRGLLQANPAHGVRAPRDHREPRPIPDDDTIDRILTLFHDGVRHPGGRWAMHPQPAMHLMARTAVATGMRPSEIAGLALDDLDPAAGAIRVTAQANPAGDRAPLKTAASRRTIAVDPATLTALRQWAADHPAEDGRVFHRPGGRPMHYRAMERAWRRMAAHAHLTTGVTWHSLRHAHATRLLRAGVPVKTVQARLGHSSAAMTMEVYAHALPADDTMAAAIAVRGLGSGTNAGPHTSPHTPSRGLNSGNEGGKR